MALKEETLSRMWLSSEKLVALKRDNIQVSMEEMYSYGYQWDGMLPLTKERALELLDTEMVLHKLYDDGAEATLDSREEILEHEGLFGVERDAWVSYLESQSQSAVQGMTQKCRGNHYKDGGKKT